MRGLIGSGFADEEYAYEELKQTWRSQGPRFPRCWHIAVAGRKGRIMILKWDNFQPLASIPRKGTAEAICDLKFTPANAPTAMLAAASHDTNIYIYNVAKGYQCAAVPTPCPANYFFFTGYLVLHRRCWCPTPLV